MQYDFGVINTATTTGGDLATLLQNWRDAVLSNHSGTTRPTYVKAGQIWVNTSNATSWAINLYDGSVDIPLGYVNTTDDTAGFLTRALVTTKSASATIVLGERDMTVGIVASTANLAMTLPVAATAKNGFRIRFQKRDNTAFTVSINRAGTDLINGAASLTLTQQYDTVEMVSDGTSAWYAYGGLLDSAVTTAKIANLAVTNAKIAANAIDFNKLDSYLQASIMPVGMISPFAGYTPPNSAWMMCYGQALNRTTYAGLFSVIGGSYGAGDGSTTFNLPDLRGRVAAGYDDMGGVRANRLNNVAIGWWMGAAGGAEVHALSINEMPAHSHSFNINSRDYSGSGGSSANYQAGISGAAVNTNSQGSGWGHNNIQPTLVVNYIIKVV